jgi:hypothetical protein
MIRILFLKSGTAKEVFEALARAALAERRLEVKFGKTHTTKKLYMN